MWLFNGVLQAEFYCCQSRVRVWFRFNCKVKANAEPSKLCTTSNMVKMVSIDRNRTGEVEKLGPFVINSSKSLSVAFIANFTHDMSCNILENHHVNKVKNIVFFHLCGNL